jgi:hypothetical protein
LGAEHIHDKNHSVKAKCDNNSKMTIMGKKKINDMLTLNLAA